MCKNEFIVVLVLITINICVISRFRSFLFEFLVCQMGGKHNKAIKIRKEASMLELLTMKYIEPSLSKHLKRYRIWRRIYLSVFVIFPFFDVLTIILCYKESLLFIPCYIFSVSINILLLFIIRMQLDSSRRYKYW